MDGSVVFTGLLSTFVGNSFGSSLLVTHMLGFPTIDDFGGTKWEIGYAAVIYRDAGEPLVPRDLETILLDGD